MDILAEFDKFLPVWCHEHHLPKPRKGNRNKVWLDAWYSFMSTYLKEHYDEVRQDFLNIKVLNPISNRPKKIITESLDEDSEDIELTPWEQVEKFRQSEGA